jgi:ssDNA-binding Zn-finger/Zn-ribbon topoisomerase 1
MPPQTTPDLKRCPNCGKPAGEVRKGDTPSRFPFRVECTACDWRTDPVRLENVAVKLWNETKLPKAAKEKHDRRQD